VFVAWQDNAAAVAALRQNIVMQKLAVVTELSRPGE